MEGIKIEVTGNIARVIERPSRITSGTVGLPIEFTFDGQWGGLSKVAVFRAERITKTIDLPGTDAIVPWEVLENSGPWLSVGVYGTNAEGTVVIPTIWANVAVIYMGVDPDGDPSTDPTPSVWEQMQKDVDATNRRIDNIVLEYAPTPDWLQNDPNGPGYIKNKPDLSELDTDSVLYTEQNLTEAQKVQARENIGALKDPAGGTLDLEGASLENAGSISVYNYGEEVTVCINAGYPGSYDAIYFSSVNGNVQICGVAPGEQPNDAVNLGQLNETVGSVSTALDHILSIQDIIIGGEG